MSIRVTLPALLLAAGLGLAAARAGSDLTWSAIQVNTLIEQGDAHLIQTASGATVLVDTGHPVYAEGLLAFLRSRGVTNLDCIVITHGHHDHIGGLRAILESDLGVGSVYFNPPTLDQVRREPGRARPELWPPIRRALKARAIPLRAITNGMAWALGPDTSLTALYAHDGISPPLGVTDMNDMSAVLMLRHGAVRFLLAGDMNRTLGAYAVRNQAAVPIQADVLKAPHHGAEGLPENDFFDAVAPRALVVPAPAHLWLSERSRRLREWAEKAGVPAYVNGLHGTITVTSDGRDFRIGTEAPGP
jgi:competence protein ComEC